MNSMEARILTERAHRCDIDNIEYKIREAAKKGECHVDVCMDGCSDAVIKDTIIALHTNGFVTKKRREEDFRSGGTSINLYIVW